MHVLLLMLVLTLVNFAETYHEDLTLLQSEIFGRKQRKSSLSFPITFGNPWLTKRIALYKLLAMRRGKMENVS